MASPRELLAKAAGAYDEHVVPRLVDLACGGEGMDRWRKKATAGLAGTIVEIGFGSGRNLANLPAEVTEVLAVEPSERARALSAPRVAAAKVPVRFVGLDGQSIPLDDASCDGALVTFTLCTIPDPSLALAELRRVLRPGAELHFLEHGLADDPRVAAWQRRLDPLEVRLAGGCHLTRVPDELVASAGFELREVTRRFARGPKPWSFFACGVGVAPR